MGSVVLGCLVHLAAARELTSKSRRNHPIHPHDWRIRELQETSVDTSPPTRLKFRPDGTFKILFLTDLHFGEDEAKDNETMQLHRRFLQMEKPDLVVLGGDQVCNSFWKILFDMSMFGIVTNKISGYAFVIVKRAFGSGLEFVSYPV